MVTIYSGKIAFNRELMSSSGRARDSITRSPVALWNTHAGCEATEKLAKISPSPSRTLGKVKPWREMNSSISPCVPFQATPTMLTLPAHFLLTSSTEGASLLQVPQYGAQNQKAVGVPMYEDPKSAGAAFVVVLAIASVGEGADGLDALGVEPPQLAKATTRSATSERRRIIVNCLVVAARLR